jgi:hypothetical protein
MKELPTCLCFFVVKHLPGICAPLDLWYSLLTSRTRVSGAYIVGTQ